MLASAAARLVPFAVPDIGYSAPALQENCNLLSTPSGVRELLRPSRSAWATRAADYVTHTQPFGNRAAANAVAMTSLRSSAASGVDEMCDCRKNTSLRFQNPSAIRQQSSGNKVANTSLRSDAASGLDEACDHREREHDPAITEPLFFKSAIG